jgi:hypothetical protein
MALPAQAQTDALSAAIQKAYEGEGRGTYPRAMQTKQSVAASAAAKKHDLESMAAVPADTKWVAPQRGDPFCMQLTCAVPCPVVTQQRSCAVTTQSAHSQEMNPPL